MSAATTEEATLSALCKPMPSFLDCRGSGRLHLWEVVNGAAMSIGQPEVPMFWMWRACRRCEYTNVLIDEGTTHSYKTRRAVRATARACATRDLCCVRRGINWRGSRVPQRALAC